MQKSNAPVFKKIAKVIKLVAPFCPKCNGLMREETNLDARTLWHYACTKCGHKY